MRRGKSPIRWRDEAIISLLESLGRARALTADEQALMERTVDRIRPKREVWRWREKEDRAILALINSRPVQLRYVHYGRPFERNDEVRKLAQELGRTEWAVYRRIERLRKRANCSDASE